MAESKDKHTPRIANRKARHDYLIEESMEVGIVLTGSEVKSIRNGQVSLGEGYARIDPRSLEMHLIGVNIAPYSHAGPTTGHEPTAPRKLLAHKRQVRQLLDQISSKGVTLIPLTMYFVRGKVKVELGVCRGKQAADKRQDMKQRDADKEIRRAMTRKVI